MQELIKEFIAQKRFAVIGASNNTHKYGYKIFKYLKSRGYEVYPVNPRINTLEGTKCYATLTDIPVKIDVADFVIPPRETEKVLRDCKRLGLDRIWLQPGSESNAAIAFCHENNMKIVYGVCIMLR